MTRQKILITGSAGFIGFHLSELLLKEGLRVHGYDGMTAYYDLALKRGRLAMLHQREGFGFTQAIVSIFASPTIAAFSYLAAMLLILLLKPSGLFAR